MYRIVFLLCFFAVPALAGKVLVIESYHAQFAWDQGYRNGLASELMPQHQLVFFEMDTKRLPTSEYQMRADLAYEFYLQQKPDLVVLGDDNALAYMLPKLYQAPVPIVFLGINSNPRALLEKYKGQAGVTGVLERPFFTKTMAGVGEVLDSPRTNPKVLIMFDSSNTSKIAVHNIQNQIALIKSNLNIDTHIETYSTQRAWYNAVTTAKNHSYSAIVVGLYQTLVDSEGVNATESEVMEWTSQNSQVPIFGFWDFSVGHEKAAGGVVLYGVSQGKQAGVLAKQILNDGISASDIPIEIGDHGMEIYSQKEFQRWGLVPPSDWTSVD